MQDARTTFYRAVDISWRDNNTEALKWVSINSRQLAKAARNYVDTLYPYCGLQAASPDTEIIILERYEKPTEAGTLAYGYLVIAGERFPYRLVDWDEDTEKAGLVAANKGAGQWNYGLLADVILELDAINFDLDFTLFEKTEIANIMDGRSAPEPGSGSGGGDEKAMGSLSEKFLIAPFSVLNAREGWWQNRKRAWISLGIESEKGRGGGA